VQSGYTKQLSGGFGKPFNSPFTYVLVDIYDICSNQYLYSADGVAWESDYVANDLSAANADVMVPVVDLISGNPATAHVDLDWVATSPMQTHQFSNLHINLTGIHYSALSTGNYREANAFGTVRLGSGPSLTPDAGIFNYIIRGTVADIININFVRPRMANPRANVTYKDVDVRVSPNPTTEVLHVMADQVVNYRITNVLGATVAQSNVENKFFDIDVTGLAKGIYLLSVQTANGESVKKFVKE
jgi:hypothetical protein